MNAIQERLYEFANQHGGLREVSRKMGRSDNYLGSYVYGASIPGNKLQEELRKLGCDIEWLMTGKETSTSPWEGLTGITVIGTNDPPEGTTTPLMLTPASCGEPSEVFEGIAAFVDVGRYHNKHTFYVEAKGESMTGAGITEGDLLLVDVEKEPRSGNIVLARLSDNVSVKRYKANGTAALLHPENPDYEPIPLSKHVRILGVVIRIDKYLPY